MYLKTNDDYIVRKQFREIYLAVQKLVFDYTYFYESSDFSFEYKLETMDKKLVLSITINREGNIKTFIIDESNTDEMTKQYGLMLLYIF